MDERTGAATFADAPGPARCGVLGEIVRRVWPAEGKALAVRGEDIPAQGSVAAILRYPI